MTLAADWLNLLLRWAHLVVGIGWIGTSFYFMALDYGLRRREGMAGGVAGTSWLVHGGGFYHVEKYLLAPDALPADLVWYRWEAYLTWITGFGLLIVQYYWQASAFLIDPAVLPLTWWQAVLISIASLAAGWLVYNAICRSPIGQSPPALAAAVFVLILAAAFLFQHVFSGRGAMIHVGAFIGTIMAVNVFGVIIPNQRRIVASLVKAEQPDPALGKTGKQRSTHNNYLTLPVLLLMVSNHYPMLTGHPQAWLLVALILVMGATVRYAINRHDAGEHFGRFGWTLPAALAALAWAVWLTAPAPREPSAGAAVTEAAAMAIIDRHCVPCHAAAPRHEGFAAPPKDVVLQSAAEVRRHAQQVLAQAVRTRAMPPGNESGMTDAERAALGSWLEGD